MQHLDIHPPIQLRQVLAGPLPEDSFSNLASPVGPLCLPVLDKSTISLLTDSHGSIHHISTLVGLVQRIPQRRLTSRHPASPPSRRSPVIIGRFAASPIPLRASTRPALTSISTSLVHAVTPSAEDDDTTAYLLGDTDFEMASDSSSPGKMESKLPGETRRMSAVDQANDLLEGLGYTPELSRNRSTLQVAFMSFVLASIPYGLATTLYYPLVGGGPVNIIWGWVAVSLIIVCVASSLGEITSVYPTAGGT